MHSIFRIMIRKLFIFFSVLLTLEQEAQTWCPPGATWNYEIPYIGIGGVGGVLEYRYDSDTIINGLNSKKVVGVFSGTAIGRSITQPTLIQNWQSYYARYSNNVLYVFNGTEFDTVVNYSASIGDKWLHYRTPSLNNYSSGLQKSVLVEVSDTGHVTINNQVLRRIKTKTYIKTLSANQTNTFQIILNEHVEKIMNDMGNAYSDLFAWNVDWDYGTYCGSTAFLNCYKDNAFPVYSVPGANCKMGVGLTELEKSQTTWKVFPNPVHSTLLIQSEKETDGKTYELRILDILGKTQKSLSWDGKEEITLSDLQPGLYQLEIKYKGLRESIETFIKE